VTIKSCPPQLFWLVIASDERGIIQEHLLISGYIDACISEQVLAKIYGRQYVYKTIVTVDQLPENIKEALAERLTGNPIDDRFSSVTWVLSHNRSIK